MTGIIWAAKANMTGTPFQVEARYHATPCGRLGPPSAEEKRKCTHGLLGPTRGRLFTVAREYPAG